MPRSEKANQRIFLILKLACGYSSHLQISRPALNRAE